MKDADALLVATKSRKYLRTNAGYTDTLKQLGSARTHFRSCLERFHACSHEMQSADELLQQLRSLVERTAHDYQELMTKVKDIRGDLPPELIEQMSRLVIAVFGSLDNVRALGPDQRSHLYNAELEDFKDKNPTYLAKKLHESLAVLPFDASQVRQQEQGKIAAAHDELARQIAVLEAESALKDSKLRDVERSRENRADELTRAKQDAASLRDSVRVAEAKTVAVQTELREANRAIDDARATVARLTQDLARKDAQLADKDDHVTFLQSELEEAAAADADKIRELSCELGQSKKAARLEIEDTTRKLVSIRTQWGTASASLADKTAELQTAHASVVETSAQLEEARQRVHQLETQIVEKEQAYDVLCKQVSTSKTTETSLDECRRALAQATTENGRLHNEAEERTVTHAAEHRALAVQIAAHVAHIDKLSCLATDRERLLCVVEEESALELDQVRRGADQLAEDLRAARARHEAQVADLRQQQQQCDAEYSQAQLEGIHAREQQQKAYAELERAKQVLESNSKGVSEEHRRCVNQLQLARRQLKEHRAKLVDERRQQDSHRQQFDESQRQLEAQGRRAQRSLLLLTRMFAWPDEGEMEQVLSLLSASPVPAPHQPVDMTGSYFWSFRCACATADKVAVPKGEMEYLLLLTKLVKQQQQPVRGDAWVPTVLSVISFLVRSLDTSTLGQMGPVLARLVGVVPTCRSSLVTLAFRELAWKCQQRFGTFVAPDAPDGIGWACPGDPQADTPLDRLEQATRVGNERRPTSVRTHLQESYGDEFFLLSDDQSHQDAGLLTSDTADFILYLHFGKREALVIEKSWATIRPSPVWPKQQLILRDPHSITASPITVLNDPPLEAEFWWKRYVLKEE